MTLLALGKPFETKEPVLLVENKLAVGPHLFRLVVVDDDGLQSDPFDAVVRVVEGPLGPIGPIGPIGTIPVVPVNPIGPVVNPVSPIVPIIRSPGGPQ